MRSPSPKRQSSFTSLLRQDLILAWRNGLVAVALGLSLLFILLIDFAVPREVRVTAKEYVVDLTSQRNVEQYLKSIGKGDIILPNEEALMDRLTNEKTSVGIVFREGPEFPRGEVIHQGNEPPKALNTLDAAMTYIWNQASGIETPTYHRVVSLRPQAEKPPFNKTLVPVLLATEVATLGFIFAAVMVFQEKSEGSVRAYRMSPAGTWKYVLSKAASNVVLSMGYGLVLLVFTMGLRPEMLTVLPLLFLASLLFTVIGLSLCVFFKDISDFLYPFIALFMLIGLPIAAYFYPALKTPWLEAIPSYPLLFGMREVLFPTGKTGFYGSMALTLLVESILFFLLAGWSVHRNLMKEGR